MKRQLIAALLALNVAAVAVPSATFTVNAEEAGIETQSAETTEVDSLKKTAVAELERLSPTDGESRNTVQTAEIAAIKKSAADEVLAIQNTTLYNDAEKEINRIKEETQKKIDDVPSATYITNAKAQTGISKDNASLSIDSFDPDDYAEEDRSAVGSLQNDTQTHIDAALSKAAVTKEQERFVTELGKYLTLAKHRDNAKKQINDYLPAKAGGKDEVYGLYKDLSDDVQDTHDLLATTKNTYKDNVDASEKRVEIAEFVEKCKKDLDKIPTAKEAQTMTDTTAKAIKELTDYYPNGRNKKSYTSTQSSEIEKYRTDGLNKINAIYGTLLSGVDIGTETDVTETLTDAKAKIDAVPTIEDLRKTVAEVIEEIDKLGTIQEYNYKEKYDALVAAENSFEAVEGGASGQQQVTNKDQLAKQRSNYDQLKTKELELALAKLGLDNQTAANKAVTLNTYRTIKTELDRLKEEAKKVKDSSVMSAYTTSYNGVHNDGKTGYFDVALSNLENSIATNMNNAFTTADVSNIKEVTDKNKASVEEAIRLYEEVVGINKDNSTAALKKHDYDKLVSLLKAYNAAKEDTDLSAGSITAIPDQVYTGKAIEITNLEVKDRNGKVVDAANYDVSYVNHTNRGTATIKVNAKGNTYTGSLTGSFNIVARDIKDAKVTVENLYYRSGKARNASPVVKVDGVDIARNRDYTVTYKNNINVGLATVEITGVGNYTGKTSGTYAIMPEKAKITSLKAGTKKFTVKVVQEKGAKYQVAYKVKGSSKYKTVTTKNVTKTVKGLKKGKTYSVKVRAYQTINGKKYLGNYSNVKNVKVK